MELQRFSVSKTTVTTVIIISKFCNSFSDYILSVSMGLTVSRQTAKNLTVNRQTAKNLTVSRQTAKNLTVNREKRGNFTVNRQKSSFY